jgi:membrane protease YdiL (CAAX protease family)
MAPSENRSNISLYFTIVLAFALWFIMFILRPLNFWLMLSLSTSLLGASACVFGGRLLRRDDMRFRNVLLGVVSAGLLYLIFWMGNETLMVLSRLMPGVLPDRAGNIHAVYANRGGLSPFLVGVLLLFPIGFGEELFWRGFVQRRLGEKRNPFHAFLVTTLLYTGVHLPTGNPVLILAALTCGLFWGGLYWASGSLVAVLLSHMLWDPAIFVLWPIT